MSDTRMKILVVGGGGREHAIIWKLSESDRVEAIFAAPGNPGIGESAKCININAEDINGIAGFAVSEKMDLVVVGPEVPLCLGLTDFLERAGIAVFGPTAAASRLEGSKAFAKDLMKRYSIPTAAFEIFSQYEKAKDYIKYIKSDMWIKASGLAAGKGAIYASDALEADKILKSLMVEGIYGDSGRTVIIEENMSGEEASIFALCDGADYKLLVPSQDHKRAFDNDDGPNTGGMGAYAPAPVVTPEISKKIEIEVIQPVLESMAAEGSPYKGLLYAGVMLRDKRPKVVEFNCRFGDPETQAVLPLLDGDLAEMMLACTKGGIGHVPVNTAGGFAMCVVMASGGYPGKYEKGYTIEGLDEADSLEKVKVFHAGTSEVDGKIVTDGGRVLGVTGWGDDYHEASSRAYNAVDMIKFEKSFFRKDIGAKALKYLIKE